LKGFNKKHHTVPDAATPATVAFLGRLVAPELEEEAEDFFQRTRAALGYKRREISLLSEGGRAVLETKDFSLEWLYALAEEDPGEWVRTFALTGLSSRDLLGNPGFDALFRGVFGVLEFHLASPVQVEAVIDAVEEAGEKRRSAGAAEIVVEYPSNCSRCLLRVGGTDVVAVFTGDVLRMEFPQSGSPLELAEEFARIRGFFDILNA
jgi:hypothetical protein